MLFLLLLLLLFPECDALGGNVDGVGDRAALIVRPNLQVVRLDIHTSIYIYDVYKASYKNK